MQDTRQDLDRGGFARAVRTDEPEQFPRFHLEREIAYCLNGAVLRMEESTLRSAHPGGLAFGLEGFLEVCYFDGWHRFINTKSTTEHKGLA